VAENRIFYPLVEKTLTEDEKQRMLAEFESYEAKEGQDAVKEYQTLVSEMAELV